MDYKDKKVIALCATYYQLIVLIQLKKTLLYNSTFDIILTDDSRSSLEVCKRLKEQQVFDSVFYFEKKKILRESKGIINKLSRYKQYISAGDITDFLPDKRYDIFMTFNILWFTFLIYEKLSSINKSIEVVRFEEGLISYYVSEKRFDGAFFKPAWAARRLLRKPNIFANIHRFLCFFPEIYEGPLQPERIPVIESDNADFKQLLISIFDINTEKICYKEKYLYFTTMLDQETDESPTGELDLVKRISTVVGSDHMMVKIHPRDDKQRFINAGLKIDANSDLPFEIIQLIYDFSDTVFLTTLSGTVLTVTSIIDNPPKIFFTYKLHESSGSYIKKWGSTYEKLIRKMKKKNLLKTVQILEDIKDLINNSV